METDDSLAQMARRCYGYGRWDAPHWFIGPEQGQSCDSNGTLVNRIEAWRNLGAKELCDCRAFHEAIKEYRFHWEPVRLQKTWKSLILLLLTYLQKPTDQSAVDNEKRREYQSNQWGACNGETCVIELSGLPANNLKIQVDRGQFREERIETIRERIRVHRPTLIVMYGEGDRLSWQQIAKSALARDKPLKIGPTIFLYTVHPNTRHLKNEHWLKLGQELRRASGSF